MTTTIDTSDQSVTLYASPDSVTGNKFGRSINSKGEYMVVTGNNSGNEGRVYVYKLVNGTWTQQLNIYNSGDFIYNTDNTQNKSWYFGNTADISSDGTRIVIGESFSDIDGGSNSRDGKFYIFHWEETAPGSGNYVFVDQNVTQPTFDSDPSLDRLGGSCSISANGTVAVVGAHYDDSAASRAGSVAVYKYNSGWSVNQEIQEPTVVNSFFGQSLHLNEEGTMFAVAGNDNIVYVYYDSTGSTSSNFSLVNTVTGGTHGSLGSGNRSLHCYGNYVLMGDAARNEVLLYERTSTSALTLRTSINSPDTASNFGTSVCLDGTTILIGDTTINTNGRAYLYLLDESNYSVSNLYKFTTSNNYTLFSDDVEINGNHIFVGHRSYSTTTNEIGAFYYYNISVCFASGSLVLTKDGEKAVETLKRGDLIWTETGEYHPLARLHQGNGQKDTFVVFGRGSLGPNEPHTELVITGGHPIYFKNEYYNPEDFAEHEGYPEVSYEEAKEAVKMYTLQFEEHHVISVNGMKVTSLPPYTRYRNQWLPKEQYFDQTKYDEKNIGKHYPPYMLHTDPLPRYVLE